MTNEELLQTLSELGIPVAYRQFSKPVKPPFICYLETFTRNFGADGVTFQKIRHIQVELYTKLKDGQLEEQMERLLHDHSIPWDSTESFLDDEKVYQIIYDIEV